MSDIERRGNTPEPAPAAVPPMPGRGTLIARGLLHRCPMCGGADLFPGWFRMRERCPACRLKLDRGEHDAWSGAWMLNLVAVETMFVLIMVGVVIALWPDVSWPAITWTGALGMIALPLLLFPASRTLWLAFDLIFQPARETDFD